VSHTVPNPLEPEPRPEPEPAMPSLAVAPVAAGPVNARAGISNRALNLLLGAALVLAAAGVAFAAGRMTAPAPALTGGTFPGGGVFNGQANGNGRPNGNGNGAVGIIGNGGGPSIEGTVESVTDTTLTIKTADGQTIQIALAEGTTYHAQTDASASDVVTGSKVLVRLDFRRGDGATGPSASAGPGGGTTGMTANDVTVVP
jgi:hypothetical protein